MCLQITKLGELAQVAFSCSGVEAEVSDNLLCGEFVFIGHKHQNIDQFLC